MGQEALNLLRHFPMPPLESIGIPMPIGKCLWKMNPCDPITLGILGIFQWIPMPYWKIDWNAKNEGKIMLIYEKRKREHVRADNRVKHRLMHVENLLISAFQLSPDPQKTLKEVESVVERAKMMAGISDE